MMKISELKKLIEQGSPVSGWRATYYQINDRWGFKQYRELRYAEKAYELQKKAARVNLAPNVGDFIPSLRGFFTEHVIVVEEGYIVSDCMSFRNRQEFQVIEPLLQPIIKDLQTKVSSLDIDCDDLHQGNIGWKDGVPVMIDFV